MVLVAGPRVDPRTLAVPAGVEVLTWVADLSRHLAAADIAVVDGDLATTMELVANRRPFILFPLARHCEQRIHVAHRLHRHGAGRRMELAESPPELIATAVCEGLHDPIDYPEVDGSGARRAAELLAELL